MTLDPGLGGQNLRRTGDEPMLSGALDEQCSRCKRKFKDGDTLLLSFRFDALLFMLHGRAPYMMRLAICGDCMPLITDCKRAIENNNQSYRSLTSAYNDLARALGYDDWDALYRDAVDLMQSQT